jgi:hypothetical protein
VVKQINENVNPSRAQTKFSFLLLFLVGEIECLSKDRENGVNAVIAPYNLIQNTGSFSFGFSRYLIPEITAM